MPYANQDGGGDRPTGVNNGPFQDGYTYVVGISENTQVRADFEDAFAKYVTKHQEQNPEFRAAIFKHFDDDHCSGKHTIQGDHYHIVATREISPTTKVAFPPSNTPLYYWIRRYCGAEDRQLDFQLATGQVIWKAPGLFNYLRKPPRTLLWYSTGLEELVFEDAGCTFLHHEKVNENSLPPLLGSDGKPIDGDTDLGKAMSTSKSGAFMYGLMSLVRRSQATSRQSFSIWLQKQPPMEYAEILSKYISKANFDREFQKALDWYICLKASKPWKEQINDISLPSEVKYMSVERSIEMFNLICEWNHFDRMQLIRDCVNVITKQCQKKNTLLFIGGSNAGKSQLAQSLALTYAKVSRLYQGQSNNFIFGDALNANVILHQEALFSKTMFETYKLVMEGEICEVAVKCKPNAELFRKPYIITCNVIPWAMAEHADANAFENRCFRYDFSPCPGLRHFGKDGNMNPNMWRTLLRELVEFDAQLLEEMETELECTEVVDVNAPEFDTQEGNPSPSMTPEEHDSCSNVSEVLKACAETPECPQPAKKKRKRN